MMSIKGLLRWSGISLIITTYMFILGLFIMGYGVTLKYSDILQSDEQVTTAGCNAIVDNLSISFAAIAYVAFFGYLISIALILLIYKKVR